MKNSWLKGSTADLATSWRIIKKTHSIHRWRHTSPSLQCLAGRASRPRDTVWRSALWTSSPSRRTRCRPTSWSTQTSCTWRVLSTTKGSVYVHHNSQVQLPCYHFSLQPVHTVSRSDAVLNNMACHCRKFCVHEALLTPVFPTDEIKDRSPKYYESKKIWYDKFFAESLLQQCLKEHS